MEQLRSRIEEIAKYKEVSIRQMESVCQLKRGNLSNISKEGTIGLDKASKIIDAFPDISPDWLISGKGSMLREDYKTKQSGMVIGQAINGDIHNNGRGKVHISSVSLAPSKIYDNQEPSIKQKEQRQWQETGTLNRVQENQIEILMGRNRTLEMTIEDLKAQLQEKESMIEWLKQKCDEETTHNRALVNELLGRERP